VIVAATSRVMVESCSASSDPVASACEKMCADEPSVMLHPSYVTVSSGKGYVKRFMQSRQGHEFLKDVDTVKTFLGMMSKDGDVDPKVNKIFTFQPCVARTCASGDDHVPLHFLIYRSLGWRVGIWGSVTALSNAAVLSPHRVGGKDEWSKSFRPTLVREVRLLSHPAVIQGAFEKAKKAVSGSSKFEAAIHGAKAALNEVIASVVSKTTTIDSFDLMTRSANLYSFVDGAHEASLPVVSDPASVTFDELEKLIFNSDCGGNAAKRACLKESD
jgi:hypothetical protein